MPFHRRNLAITCLTVLGLLSMNLFSHATPGKAWGLYQIHWGAESFEAGLKEQIELLGARPNYVMFFRDLSPHRGFPTQILEICHRYEAIPVINQELWMWRKRQADDHNWLEQINQGIYDAYWTTWAEAASAYQHTVVLRLGFEMNGDWFSWGQQPEAFIAAWQRIHQIIRSKVGADNVQFMFSPNVEWDANKPLSAIELYYPGDAYVDLLGLDGYNFGDHHSAWHTWQSYSEIFEASIAKMSQWPQPLFIAEIGCADGPRKAEWMVDFLQDFTQDERLSGFIYYNFNDGKRNEPDWRLNSDPNTLKVFQNYLSKSNRNP